MKLYKDTELLETIAKGLITGILVGYLIIYGLRPSVPYPEYILDFFENKWIFLILVIIIYYAFLWDYTIAVLLLLSTIALIFDYVIFTNSNPLFIKNESATINDNFPIFV